MSGRAGSADSVVLPVPDRPKKRATFSRSSRSTLQEQCMGSTERSGSSWFMAKKIDFFISPA
jgi:hypothetical protein